MDDEFLIREYALEASTQSALLFRRKSDLEIICKKWMSSKHPHEDVNDIQRKKKAKLGKKDSSNLLGINHTSHTIQPDCHEELNKNLTWLVSLATTKPPASVEPALMLPITVTYFINMLRDYFPEATYIQSPKFEELIHEALEELQSNNSIKLDLVKVDEDDPEETAIIIDASQPREPIKLISSLKLRCEQILMATNAANISKVDILSGTVAELKEIEDLIAKKSFKQKQVEHVWEHIDELLAKPSAKLQLVNEKFMNKEDVLYRDFCEWGLRSDCKKKLHLTQYCTKLHFRRIMLPQTDIKLGDCSYLNTCHHMDTCKFVHYEFDENARGDIERPLPVLDVGKPLRAQWINCDVRKLDYTILGKFSVIMADPPWDIHMQLPYGTMTDEEMKSMPISVLQDEGYIFLWVTGRAIELGRECLITWGYDRVDELIWVKTNQIQKLIRTGRTGHWLNHSKEHCIIGVKRKDGANIQNGRPFNLGIDTDVLVAEVRETSWKPDEIYGLIDRLSPGTRKLEIFGRQHNTRDGWMTLGNQLDGVRIVESEVLERYNAAYPHQKIRLANIP